MNKMLVSVFDSESAAFEGVSALRDLHRDGDISLYGAVVIEKDAEGEARIVKKEERGAQGAGVGLLAGGFLGLLAGPGGVLVGASVGGLTGMVFDLNRAGVDFDFVREVAEVMQPGKIAVLADIEEEWTAPVDTRLGEHGGVVFRRLRAEVAEDALVRESEAFEAELNELDAELAEAGEDTKAAIQKSIETVKEKLATARRVAETRLEETKSQVEAKVSSLEEQLKEAGKHKAAKIQKRIADAKAGLESSTAKCKRAIAAATEALKS